MQTLLFSLLAPVQIAPFSTFCTCPIRHGYSFSPRLTGYIILFAKVVWYVCTRQ